MVAMGVAALATLVDEPGREWCVGAVGDTGRFEDVCGKPRYLTVAQKLLKKDVA